MLCLEENLCHDTKHVTPALKYLGDDGIRSQVLGILLNSVFGGQGVRHSQGCPPLGEPGTLPACHNYSDT